MLSRRPARRSWGPRPQELDRSILMGVVFSFTLLAIPVAVSGQALNFLDWKGFLIVIGGTFGATLAHFSVHDLRYSFRVLRQALSFIPPQPAERISEFIRLSQAVRAEGPMALERAAQRSRDPFLRKAFELTVDGQPMDDVRRMLETEMRTSHEESARAVQVFEALGTFAPALGLIGTLVGLIQMLSQLHDPTKVGPAMSIALVTTLYGAVLSNLIFLPIAGKLRLRNESQWVLKSLVIEGTQSLAKGENPVIIEQRLKGYLPHNNAMGMAA